MNFLALEQFRWEGGVGAEYWLGSALKPGKHTVVFDFKYAGCVRMPVDFAAKLYSATGIGTNRHYRRQQIRS